MVISPSDSFTKQVVAFSIIILIARSLIIPFSGIMPQDAYYYMYSRHLSLSYFDHPAGVAFLLKAGTFVLGNSPAAVIFCALLTSLLTLFVVYRLAVQFISKQQALIFVCVLACTPMFGILGWIVTPDVPLMLFWALSVLFIYKADREGKTTWWMLAGFLTGLSFDSKYTAVFIVAGVFLYLLAKPDRWRKIFSFNILVYLLAFAVTILPVFIWNMQNNWASIHFQTTQRAQELSLSLKPQYPFAVLLLQLVLLLPWLFFYFIRSFRSFKKDSNHYFLLCFSVPMFGFFLFISFFYWVKINWMMPAFITGSLLAFQHLSQKQVKWHMITGAVIFVLASVELIWYPIPVKSHDTWWGWDSVANEASMLRRDTKSDFIFSTDDYKTSAILRLYLKEKVYAKNIIKEPALQFDFMGEDISSLNGQNAIYVCNIRTLKDSDTSEKLEKVKQYFSDVRLIKSQVLNNVFGKECRMVKYYYCSGYNARAIPGN
ncbi:ArnT family glycosyltransferase [Flavihumibacter fluvii]|uniref:ArnT family glycosyltransferase n=1 Tax=Flavihumibacter fluvii TaxID=2838157 RepID=UPI001BDF3DD1|nr:glycosyltransferase family 39 protein [Flavihumibacter fluvii]ULQ53628.1 glycosyltransferase family 39 protein [Flavihumibacter fluvii]